MSSRNKLLLLSKKDLIKQCKQLHLNTFGCSTKMDYVQLLLKSKDKTNNTSNNNNDDNKNEDEEKEIISYLSFSAPTQKSWTMGIKVGNSVSEKCIKCAKFCGFYDGYCSICFKEIYNLDQYGIISAKYTNALKASPIASVVDIVLMHVLHPREYYHEGITNEMREKQIIFDFWYYESRRDRKLIRAKNIMRKMISKQSLSEFISLLCSLQVWMKAKDICDVLKSLPPRDSKEKKQENAKKIIALTYFGMNFFENNGVYIKWIIARLRANNGQYFICYKMVDFGIDSNSWTLCGKHVIQPHFSTKYIDANRNYVNEHFKNELTLIKAPVVDEKTLFYITSMR